MDTPQANEAGRIVGQYLKTPIFYTSYALAAFNERRAMLFANCERFDWFTFSVNFNRDTVAVFRINWKQ